MTAGLLEPLVPDKTFLENGRLRIVSIYAYWKDQCGIRPMPRRTDIDPTDFTEHLPGIILIDVERNENKTGLTFRYRVVGTREVANRHRDPTGETVEEGFFAESVDAALRSYNSVCHHRQPIFETLSFVSKEGVPVHEDSIMLPLSENGNEVSQILVYSESQDDQSPIELQRFIAESQQGDKTETRSLLPKRGHYE